MLQRYFKRHWLLIGLLSVSFLLPSVTEVAQAKTRAHRQRTTLVKKVKPSKTLKQNGLSAQAAPATTPSPGASPAVNPSPAVSPSAPAGTAPAPIASPSTVASPISDSFVPAPNEIHLLLKLGERKVYVYRGTKLINKYQVAVGKKGWETPVGNWNVQLMQKNPGWTNFKTGEVMPPGPDNPLGERWIGFWTDGKDEIGFHGTTNLKSLGNAASHGCVRMSNQNVKVLFKIVRVGTVVRVRA
jgi:lipoprotein-anchoring transpeptidase ErfK/SrfK